MRATVLFQTVIMALCLIGCSGKEQSDGGDYFRDCLSDISDLERLASTEMIEGGMASSYDRTGGNNDGFGNLGEAADGRRLLADLKGPGCVRRIWLTGMAEDAKLHFYFDGEKTPRLVKTYSELRGKGEFPFIPPLCDNASADAVCYFPLTYRESLQVTADAPKPPRFFFFQINYTRSPDGLCESYSEELLQENKLAIKTAVDQWQAVMDGLSAEPSALQKVSLSLARGVEGVIMGTNGPAEIVELRIQPVWPEDFKEIQKNAVLRMMRLEMFWDEMDMPSVSVPLGDFFCNANRVTAFESLPLSSRPDAGFISRFPMPFTGRAEIRLRNESPWQIAVNTSVLLRPVSDDVEDRGYFHAFWNETKSRGRPHKIASMKGAGRFVGCYMVSVSHEPSWNILEGDEAIYRDGEVSPSYRGTGLEDYFNGAWYYNDGLFFSPLAGVLERSGIKTTQYRFHVPDTVAFNESLLATIEFGHANASKGYMSSVAYAYIDAPVQAPLVPSGGKRLIPQDPFELGGMMCELFEKERLGRNREAMLLCREYSEKFAGKREAELMKLREAAYFERIHGFDAAKAAYEQFALEGKDKAVREQASEILSFNTSESNALLVVHANCEYKLYLDGKLLLSDDDPYDIQMKTLQLDVGEHYLAVEGVCKRRDPWFSATLKTHDGTMRTDSSWEVSSSSFDGWKSGRGEDDKWINAREMPLLPLMGWFQFVPNAAINSQHKKQLLNSPKSWNPGQKLYFRKRFVVPFDGDAASISK